METRHTKLPWCIIEDNTRNYTHITNDNMDYVARLSKLENDDVNGKANAAYIVKACNAYPELISILKEILDNVYFTKKNEDNQTNVNNYREKAHALLKTLQENDRG